VGLDGAVRGRVGDAGEHEAVAHLVVIKERLVGLVDGTSLIVNNSSRRGTQSQSQSISVIIFTSHDSSIRLRVNEGPDNHKVLASRAIRTIHPTSRTDGRTSRTEDAHPTPTVSRIESNENVYIECACPGASSVVAACERVSGWMNE